MSKTRLASAVVLTLALTAALATTVQGSHSWSIYHWARTSSSFDLIVLDSTTSDWTGHVVQATGDWSQTSKLDMILRDDSDDSKVRRQCNAPSGYVRICNLTYGYNGWLGIAGISIDTSGHIVRGYTKLNDSYFSQSPYSGLDWRQSVTCQELGHNVGLGHQDENFNNESLLSCMDYQSPPYQYPNAHDYEQLGLIYGHTDSYDSYAEAPSSGGGSGSGGDGGCNAPPGKGCNKSTVGQDDDLEPPGWGISLGRRGQQETFLRIDPDGTRHITHVTWVEGRERGR